MASDRADTLPGAAARAGGGAAPPGTLRAPRGGLFFLGILLVAANMRAAITAVGPVLGDIRADLHLTGATASVLISVPVVAFALFSPVVPVLAARIGMERSLGAALAVLCGAVVLRSLPPVAALWAGTALLGMAIAVINVVLPSLVKRDRPDHVGRFTGIYSSVQGGAAALASGFAVPLAATSQHGWRLSLGIWAGLALIGLAVFLPQLAWHSRPPQELAAVLPGHGSRHRTPWGSALGWQVTLFMGAQASVFYILITWWPSIEQASGVSATASGWHQSVFQVVSLLANLLTAAVLHRRPDQRLVALTGTACVAAGIAGQLADPGLSLLWLVLAGAGSGSTLVIALSLFGLRASGHHQAAALSGMAQSVGYAMAALGPVLIGLCHDRTGAWTWPLVIVLGLLCVQGGVGFQAARDRVIG